MNGWVKGFQDSAQEIGTDEDVSAGRASWSKGKLDNIRYVSLQHNDISVILASSRPSNLWHQADRYVSQGIAGTTSSQLVARYICRSFTEEDIGSEIDVITNETNNELTTFRIEQKHVGMMIVACIRILSKQLDFWWCKTDVPILR